MIAVLSEMPTDGRKSPGAKANLLYLSQSSLSHLGRANHHLHLQEPVKGLTELILLFDTGNEGWPFLAMTEEA